MTVAQNNSDTLTMPLAGENSGEPIQERPTGFPGLLSRFRTNGLVRDTANLTISQGLRLMIQAAYFVLLARSLGAASYGSFVAIAAAAALLAPFSGLGTGILFVRDVRSGRQEPAVCWGNGILMTLISGVSLVAAGVLIGVLAGVRSQLSVIVAICAADLVFNKITELSSYGFAASCEMAETAIQNVVISVLRLLGIGCLVMSMQKVTLFSWSLVYLLATVVGTTYALVRGAQLWGRPRLHLHHLRNNVIDGTYFSVSNAAATIYNDIDKVMLPRLSDLASTGIYGAAYRVIDVSMAPIRSLVFAAYPRFFEKGVLGIRGTYAYARLLISRSALYGIAIAVSLWLAAPILPLILGESFRSAAPALKMLAIIPFLRSMHVLLADALSGSGHQAIRTLVQVVIAVLNIGLNLLILPRWSWRGAAWTSVACDGALLVALWLTIQWCSMREERTRTEQHAMAASLSV